MVLRTYCAGSRKSHIYVCLVVPSPPFTKAFPETDIPEAGCYSPFSRQQATKTVCDKAWEKCFRAVPEEASYTFGYPVHASVVNGSMSI